SKLDLKDLIIWITSLFPVIYAILAPAKLKLLDNEFISTPISFAPSASRKLIGLSPAKYNSEYAASWTTVILCFLANATTLLKKVIVGLAGTGFPGRFNISNFALFATSAGILSKLGRKLFSAFNSRL